MGSIASLALEGSSADVRPAAMRRVRRPRPVARRLLPGLRVHGRRARRPGRPALAAFVYGGGVARAIARIKYESRPDLARPLGDSLWRRCSRPPAALRGADRRAGPSPPVAPRRARLQPVGAPRGSHREAPGLAVPSARAGSHEGNGGSKPPSTARPARPTSQARSTRDRAPGLVCDGAVLLIDDVTTTGATLSACEQALAEAGAARVERLVLASSPQRVEAPR